MKNDITYFSNYTNSTQIKYKLKSDSSNGKYIETLPNKPTNFNLLFKSSDFIQKRKNIFKKEKMKPKEYIFKSFKEVPKKQIKKDNETVIKAQKHLLHSITILKDTNLDESIVLNKYFQYLKKCGIERQKLLNIEFQNMLTPIRKKEKEIEDLKKNIKFYKSISNQMLLKYMLENKDKLFEYMKEKAKDDDEMESYREQSHKSRNNNNSPDKSNSKLSKSSSNEVKNIFLTKANNKIQRHMFLRNHLSINKNNKEKIIPKLKLKDEESNFFITGYSRNSNSSHINNIKHGKKILSNTYSPNSYSSIKKNYLTPQTTQRKKSAFLLNSNTEKSNKKTNYSTSRRSRKPRNFSGKMRNYNINNLFQKIKLKELEIES